MMTAIASYNMHGNSVSALHSQTARPIITITTSSSNESKQRPDRVSLSPEGTQKAQQSANINIPGLQTGEAPEARSDTSASTSASQQRTDKPTTNQATSEQLSQADQQVIQKLKIRDREVKSHEQAHLAAAGQYAAGGPSFTYQQGPDGQRYAIGGEVPIDVSKEKTPQETIQKMQIVKRAASAPANPSGADRRIAAAASLKEAEARRELQAEQVAPDKDTPQVAQEPTPSSSQPEQEVVPSAPATTSRAQALDIAV